MPELPVLLLEQLDTFYAAVDGVIEAVHVFVVEPS
jgi:hypothetical protein